MAVEAKARVIRTYLAQVVASVAATATAAAAAAAAAAEGAAAGDAAAVGESRSSFAGRVCLAVILAAYMAGSGLKKGSLSRGGAVAAVLVGSTSLACSYRLGATLLLFYKTSSLLTHFRADHKSRFTESADQPVGDTAGSGASGSEGDAQRGATQVLACSLPACLLALAYCLGLGLPDAPLDATLHPWGASLLAAYLCFFGCCCGDTWSSELGILSRGDPILITKPFGGRVPRGTNGGVSPLGTAAAAAGGLCMGTCFYVMGLLLSPPSDGSSAAAAVVDSAPPPSQLPLLLLGTFSGLFGSFLDSLLGATLQATYFNPERKRVLTQGKLEAYGGNGSTRGNGQAHGHGDAVLISGWDVLSNESVNLISAVLTAAAGGGIASMLF